MRRYDYITNVRCDALNDDIKGFFERVNCDILKEHSTTGTILSGMEYRPDKVAAYYLGGTNYSWMIDLANDFTEGIKDYYKGREILIPDIDTVYTLLMEV